MTKMTTELFIKKAVSCHGIRYDYSRVEYGRAKIKVTIGCLIHGWFQQTPSNHTHDKKPRGCPKCGGQQLTGDERFWNNVDKHGDMILGMTTRCWSWKGYGNGYGQFTTGGISVLAHRYSWEIYRGPIPEGMNVLHHCDNGFCTNPEHLFLGTHRDNMIDMTNKGRHGMLGKRSPNAILFVDQVKEIKALLKNGIKHKDIARQFDVSIPTISAINTRRNWAWVK